MDLDDQIMRRLTKILREHCGLEAETFKAEQRLQEDLGLDSLGLLALAVEVENDFCIHLNEDSADPPRTLGELAQLIAERMQPAP